MKGASNYEVRNFALSLPAFVLWPNMFGSLIACVIFVGLHFGLSILTKIDSRHATEISLEVVSEVIEIFLLGANAGLTHLESLKLVAETVTDPMQSEIAEVIARCNLGISLTRSLSYLTEKYPDLAATIKVISRSETTGGPIIEALELELLLIRAQATNDVLRRVRSLSVKCVLPLGLCFLPAFFLATVIPIVANLLPDILSTFN